MSEQEFDLSGYTEKELTGLLEDLESHATAKAYSPISFYSPHPHGQEAFHSSTARIRLLLGGNRSGKSTAGAVEALSHSLGYRPWLHKDDPDYIVRNAHGKPIKVPNVGTILGESYKISVDRVLWPTLKEWLPQGMVKRIGKNQGGVPDTVEFTNGSVIRFMTYNQDPKEFEGFKAHWAWYDEPPKKSIFVANERSLVDYSGRSWFTLTPIRQPWIWEDLVSEEGSVANRIAVFKMTSWDNPFLSRASLEEYFGAIKNPDERRARELGEFLHLQGRVFSMWTPTEPYFIDAFPPKQGWVRVMGIDPHPRKPIACLWAAINPESGVWYVYRELYDSSIRSVRDCALRIKDVERGENIAFRIIDPSSQENERTSDTSVYEQFMDYGIECELANRWDKMGRISLLQEMLAVDPIFKMPQVVTLNNCQRMRYEFMNMIWDDWAVTVRDDKDPKPEVKKRDDDLIDCLMYLIQYGREARDFDPMMNPSWKSRSAGKDGVLLPKRSNSLTGY